MMTPLSRRAALRGGLSTLLLIPLAGCGSSGGGTVPLTQPFPQATQDKLDAALTRTRAVVKIPGVIVSLYIPGEGTWERAVGVSDKSTQTPIVAGMHTRIGSVTKTFTATAILQLADEGKLKLDDPVSKYLDFVPNGDHITLRQMASMTSGLVSYTEDEDWVNNWQAHPEQTYTARELVDVGFRHKPHFPPGTSISYSNSNFVLLGMVIEKVSGMTVQDFFAQRIFRPLGLRNTTWPTSTDLPTPFSHGSTEQTPDGSEVDATLYSPTSANAAGQLISDLEDLKVWTKAFGEGTLLSPEMQRERLAWAPYGSATLRYGIGLGYYNGWIGHTGEIAGYNTGAYYLPSKKAVLVIQTNTDIPIVITPGDPPVTQNPVTALFREITKIVTPENIPDGPDLPGY